MSEEAGRPGGSGWRALREEREREFRSDFAPLHRAIRRNEFVSASVELFLSALVGVTKVNLGARDAAPEADLNSPPGPGRDAGVARASEGDIP